VEREAGAAVAGAVVAGARVGATAAEGAGAGATGVATVAGAEHDTIANDRRRSDGSGFMSDLMFREG